MQGGSAIPMKFDARRDALYCAAVNSNIGPWHLHGVLPGCPVLNPAIAAEEVRVRARVLAPRT